MNLLFSFLLLGIAAAQFSLTTVNSMLDPSRVTWWRTKWAASAIQLSANNKNRSGVSVTFFFSPSTSMVSGVVEVTFPSGFLLQSLASNSQTADGQVVQVAGQTVVGGQDYTITIQGVSNPQTAGAYGPFAVRTRFSASGQQVDANLSFATVYICGDPNSLGTLSVSLAGSSIKSAVNKSGNTLSFKFTIGVSLWRFDTFVISIDSRWTVASDATCSSADYAGKVNNFNGTNSANPHSLQCVASSKSTAAQQVYVYGLANEDTDVTTTQDNKYVDLRVSGVTTPAMVYPNHPYSWGVQTFRFGTATMLEIGTASSGPEVTPDAIGSASWTPTWGMAASELVPTFSCFMDLSFSLTNKVPATSAVEIVVTEDVASGDIAWVGSAPNNCYLVTNLGRGVTCTLTLPSTITLTGLPSLSAGTLIKVRNIVKITSAFDATAKVVSIKTYGAGGVGSGLQIDSGSSLAAFKIASNTATQIAAFSMTFQDSTSTSSTTANKAGGTGDYKQGVQFAIVPSSVSDVTTASTFTIACPLTAAVSDFSIGIPSSDFYFKDDITASAIDMVTGLTPVSSNKPTLTNSSSATTLGSISFAGNIGTITNGVHLLIGQPSTATTFITLPRVANNLATAYECRVTIQTATKTTHRGAIRFQVLPQAWTIASFSLPCATQVDGVPATFSLKPAVLPVPVSSASTTYYVELEIPNTTNMNSGLTLMTVNSPNKEDVMAFAVSYPVDRSNSDTLAAKLYTDGVSSFVAVSGSTQLTPTSATMAVYVPIGGLPIGDITPKVRSYFISEADARYRFITHEQSTNKVTSLTTTGVLAFPVSDVVAASNTLTAGEVLTSNLKMSLKVSVKVTAQHFMYFIFPAGFGWGSSPTVVNIDSTVAASPVSTPYATVKCFSSPAPSFKYSGVLVDAKVGSTVYSLPDVSSMMTETISFGGLKPGLSSGTQSLVAVLGASNTNAACGNLSLNIPLQTAPGTIKALTISPSTSKSRGPDGVAVKHTVSFTLAHGVPAGGSISMTIATDWDTTAYSQCSTSGLPTPTSGSIACSFATRVVTVKGFADFSSTASTSVAITVTGLLPPVSASGSVPTVFLTALSSTDGSAIIDSLTTLTGSGVTVTSSSAVSRTEWQKKTTVPMTAGATNADLYLRFTFPHSIPRFGLITISFPLQFKLTGNLKNSCFFSPLQYSDCSVNGSSLQIQLDQDYTAKVVLELYLDSAVDNPATTTSTSTGFTAKTTWAGVTIDADSGSIQSSQTFTASALLTTTLTPMPTPGLWFVPTTAGEQANYTLSFNDTVKYSTGDQYVIEFPPQFDYFIGNAFRWFDNETSVFFLECYSAELGATFCRVDHGIVVVKGTNVLPAGSLVSILLCDVTNPPPAQTGYLHLYHIDTNGNYKAINQKFGTVTPTARANNIDVRSLAQTERRLFRKSDFKWRLLISDSMNTDSLLRVLFPAEFDLAEADRRESYSCASMWADAAVSATMRTSQGWNPATFCLTYGNWVTLPGPTTATSFSSSQVVTWELDSISNPQWARNRTALSPTQDFEVTDATLWPLDPVWSSKFQFFVYRNSTGAYSSRSYDNMNVAYAGFQKPRRSLYVNFYEPLSKSGRILIYAGTQSKDILITTVDPSKPLASKQIEFTPATSLKTPDNGKLKYTSETSQWVMSQGDWSIQFRVAAAIDTPKGLYLIDWTVLETKESGLTDNQYDPPVSTLVEVVPKSSSMYWFSVASITSVTVGFTSVPVRVGISNPPNSDVTVNLSIQGSPANMTISPFSLKFGPDVNERYFQIQVGSGYTGAQTQTVLFALTGTDAYAYKILSSLKISVQPSNSVVTPGSVLNWGLGQSTRTSFSVTPITDQVGVIYYFLAAAGTAVPAFAALKSSVDSQNETESALPETDPQTNETWVGFQRRLYRNHLRTTWIGKIVMLTTSSSAATLFDSLYADTAYQVTGYLDNLSKTETDPSPKTDAATTKPTADCQPFVVKFAGYVQQSYSTQIATQVAQVIGVNPLRLVSPAYSTSRRLLNSTDVASTSFSFTLLPSRSSEVPTPTEQAKLSDASMASLSAALKDMIPNALQSVTNDVVPSRSTPKWATVPAVQSTTSDSITVSLRSSGAGEACCLPLTSSAASPTAEQIVVGLDPTNQSVNSTCVATNLTSDSNTLLMTGLSPEVQYFVFCTATDSYPLWPTLMSYTSANPLLPLTTKTLAATTQVESSWRLAVPIWIMLLM